MSHYGARNRQGRWKKGPYFLRIASKKEHRNDSYTACNLRSARSGTYEWTAAGRGPDGSASRPSAAHGFRIRYLHHPDVLADDLLGTNLVAAKRRITMARRITNFY